MHFSHLNMVFTVELGGFSVETPSALKLNYGEIPGIQFFELLKEHATLRKDIYCNGS